MDSNFAPIIITSPVLCTHKLVEMKVGDSLLKF